MSIDDTISNVAIKKPTVSTLSLAFAAATTVAGLIGSAASTDVAQSIFLTGSFVSVPLLATASTIGALNMFRNKSGLSKVFSAVSIGTGGVIAAAMMQDSSGWDWLGPVLATGPATVLASGANLASHYTRDKGLSLKVTNKPDDPSV
jgi:hypothetical protein